MAFLTREAGMGQLVFRRVAMPRTTLLGLAGLGLSVPALRDVVQAECGAGTFFGPSTSPDCNLARDAQREIARADFLADSDDLGDLATAINRLNLAQPIYRRIGDATLRDALFRTENELRARIMSRITTVQERRRVLETPAARAEREGRGAEFAAAVAAEPGVLQKMRTLLAVARREAARGAAGMPAASRASGEIVKLNAKLVTPDGKAQGATIVGDVRRLDIRITAGEAAAAAGEGAQEAALELGKSAAEAAQAGARAAITAGLGELSTTTKVALAAAGGLALLWLVRPFAQIGAAVGGR